MNGTTYVPVKLCCGKFGLSYSTLAVAGETVLRVTDGSASSDSAFAAAKSGTIENTINSYKGIPSSNGSSSNGASSNGGTAAKPDETPIPKVEEKPARKPARVYLTFYGAPDKNTAAVLDNLHDAGRQAAFFLPTDTSKWDDDLVRRIAAEGHTAAFLLQADSKTDGADMLADLAAANERLTLLTGVAARIAANQSGSDALTEAQRSNVREIDGNHVSERRISLYIKDDYIRERMLNTITDTLKAFMPKGMLTDSIIKYGIKL